MSSDSGFSNIQAVSITDAVGTTDTISYRGVRAGAVYVAAGSSLTTLTFWGSHDDVTYEAAYDNAGTPAAIALTVAADTATKLPDALEGFAYIRAVGNAAGSANVSLQS